MCHGSVRHCRLTRVLHGSTFQASFGGPTGSKSFFRLTEQSPFWDPGKPSPRDNFSFWLKVRYPCIVRGNAPQCSPAPCKLHVTVPICQACPPPPSMTPGFEAHFFHTWPFDYPPVPPEVIHGVSLEGRSSLQSDRFAALWREQG